MVALKTERRVFLWRVRPHPSPEEAADWDVTVTLDEIVSLLEAAFKGGRARCYLSNSRILADDDDEKDEKNQIYIAGIRRDKKQGTVTLLINRGDPNAVSPAFINAENQKVRTVDPDDDESPGWSSHLVIASNMETGKNAGKHRACFEQMPHLSSSLVILALNHILTAEADETKDCHYDVEVKKKSKIGTSRRKYRPVLDVKRVPSESLEHDLKHGELTSITLTKRKTSYQGPGLKELIRRQEQKVVLTTSPAKGGKVQAMVEGVTQWGKDNDFEAISFHLEKLPGGLTNRPTLLLENEDALDQLYVRAQLLHGFKEMLGACYPKICDEIEEKMIAVVHGGHGW